MKQQGHIIIDVVATMICAAVIVGGGWYVIEGRRSALAVETLAQLRQSYPNVADEQALAEIYWSRHQDVKTNPVYGKHGHLGVYGARAHYLQYGRSEQRIWPEISFRRAGKSN